MKELCGCCEGTEQLTPASTVNRPGLGALSYRVGTHGSFLETMLARLSNHALAPSQAGQRAAQPLQALTTRDAGDATIAFLDAWATVADVLTFYQERIANEGYLRTAIERRSVLELARLIGYKPRPGVAASVYLAYTLDEGSEVTIPAGSRSQSVPGPGELPQSFETSVDLAARAALNLLQPRLTRPQVPAKQIAAGKPFYFKGTATNLKPNDPLLVADGEGAGRQVLLRVRKVEPDQSADRTKVTYELWSPPAGAAPLNRPAIAKIDAEPVVSAEPVMTTAAVETLTAAVEPVAGTSRTAVEASSAAQIEKVRQIIGGRGEPESFGVNAGTQTAQRVLSHLDELEKHLDDAPARAELHRLLEETLTPLHEEHRLAREGNFTKLEPWIGSIVTQLEKMSEGLADSHEAAPSSSATETAGASSATKPTGVLSETEDAEASVEMGATTAHARVSSTVNAANAAAETEADGGGPVGTRAPAASANAQSSVRPALANLNTGLLKKIGKPPIEQPASPQQLDIGIAASLSPTSGALPKIVTTLNTELRDVFQTALGNVPATDPAPTCVYALRTRAAVFGNNAPPKTIFDEDNRIKGQEEWTLFRSTGRATTEHFVISLRTVPAEGEGNDQSRLVARVEIRDAEGTATHAEGLVALFGGNIVPLKVPAPNAETVVVTVLTPSESPNKFVDFNFRKRKVLVRVEIGSGFRVDSTGSNPTAFILNMRKENNTTNAQGGTFLVVEGDIRSIAGNEPTEQPTVVSLDASYNQILPGGWVVLERPTVLPGPPPSRLLFRRIERVSEGSRTDYSVSVKGTQLELDGAWINPALEGGDGFEVIRGTTVLAQSELLQLSEEPLDPIGEDVCGDRIELAGLVEALEPGRWLIVSGERTDITPSPTHTDNQPDASDAEKSDNLTAGTDASFGDARVGAAAERAKGRARLAAARVSRISAASGGSGAVGGAAGRKVCVAGVEMDAATGSVDGGSGSEADVVPGLKVAELVMLAGVEQGYDPGLPGDRPHTTLLLARELAYCYRRDTLRVYGNVAHATHGETRTEILGSGDAGRPAQVFTLKQSPLTYVSAPTPDGIESTLQVRVGEVLWHETDSLAGSGPKDRAYVTKTNDDDVTTVTFGNGREGARPATGVENVRAVYRTGLGKGGNVLAGQISMVLTKPLGVKEVTNPQAATGGAGREERDQMRRNAPLVVTSLDRLVSTRDYEDFARTFAGIGKASAARLSDGRRQLVHLTIAGEDDIPIAVNSDLYKNLRAALGRYGDPYQPVQIATRHLKLLVVAAKVSVQPDYLWESVEPKIRAAMLERFGFNRRDLGQDVVLSEVTATVQSVEGVAYADVDTLDEVAGDASVEKLLQIYLGLGLKPRIRARLARVDRAATDPAERILPAQLATLSPLVPEMLNLTELKG